MERGSKSEIRSMNEETGEFDTTERENQEPAAQEQQQVMMQELTIDSVDHDVSEAPPLPLVRNTREETNSTSGLLMGGSGNIIRENGSDDMTSPLNERPLRSVHAPTISGGDPRVTTSLSENISSLQTSHGNSTSITSEDDERNHPIGDTEIPGIGLGTNTRESQQRVVEAPAIGAQHDFIAATPPLLRRSGGEANPISVQLTEAQGTASSPLNERPVRHVHAPGIPSQENGDCLVPTTCLTEDVSALHTFDSGSSNLQDGVPAEEGGAMVNGEANPVQRHSTQRGLSSDSSTSLDVPPPLPLLPSPPIRGAGGPSCSESVRPTALMSGPSRDDTIATSASMVQESHFVREFGVDLDACVEGLLRSTAGAEAPATPRRGRRANHDVNVEARDEKTSSEEKCDKVRYYEDVSSPIDPAKEKTLNTPSNHSGAATSVLTDDELPAIITPPLRRQGSTATPGAYRAGGSYGNNPTEPLPPPPPLSVSSSRSAVNSPTRTMTRQVSTRVSSRLSRSFSYDSVDDSCRTPVTATLVTDQVESQGNDIPPTRREQALVVAHAEPLEKIASHRNRRCVMAWMFLVAVLVSAGLGIFSALVFNDSKAPPEAIDEGPVDTDDLADDSPLPDASNFTEMHQDLGMQSSSHTVMWGLVATCRDEAFFNRYALDLRCGGELHILHAENAECIPRMIDDVSNITDVSRASCVIRGQPEQVLLENGRLFYQDITASVVFDCVGRTLMEHTATANLPPMDIDNCSNEQHLLDERRRLGSPRIVSTHKASTISHARSRALEEVLVGGGASSYMSMGRFCSEEGNWVLWHEWYECEMGERFFFSKLFGVYHSEVPTVESWVSGTGGVVLSTFLDAAGFNSDGDRRRRRLQDLGDIPFAELASYIGAQSFCFAKESCRSEVENCIPGQNCTGCSVTTDELIMSDYDPRDSCRWTTQGPDIDERRRKVADELDPEELVNRIAAQI